MSNTYEQWSNYPKGGGVIGVHNSAPGQYGKEHDGSMRLVAERIVSWTRINRHTSDNSSYK